MYLFSPWKKYLKNFSYNLSKRDFKSLSPHQLFCSTRYTSQNLPLNTPSCPPSSHVHPHVLTHNWYFSKGCIITKQRYSIGQVSCAELDVQRYLPPDCRGRRESIWNGLPRLFADIVVLKKSIAPRDAHVSGYLGMRELTSWAIGYYWGCGLWGADSEAGDENGGSICW